MPLVPFGIKKPSFEEDALIRRVHAIISMDISKQKALIDRVISTLTNKRERFPQLKFSQISIIRQWYHELYLYMICYVQPLPNIFHILPSTSSPAARHCCTLA